ncbi:diuretic hormone class 2 isoform X1 [Drosophila guanche]|uniref:diuretic hormone class 2 isoform X1 n=1 Tax=Drosophila guanche TaxID=7266 RepID=UPI0014720CD3|nr:diuretic hormone class 2 isoform X1 [Drosophila guanche]
MSRKVESGNGKCMMKTPVNTNVQATSVYHWSLNCQSNGGGGYGGAGYNELEEVPDDLLMELMTRFGRTIIRARNDLENSKRTVDFGLARGYSGTQEAKHRMGLAAANFAGGPGRRRRSETDV